MNGHVSTETLSAYLDGELQAAEAAPLGAHLDGCAECAARLDNLRSTAATLRQLERPLPPAAVGERLRLQLAAERQRKARPLWWDALLPWRSMQPGMAAAALVFVTALLVIVQMERMATRNAESTQAKSEMRSLEEREQEAAAAPTVALPPAPRAAPAAGAARADGDRSAAVAIPESAEPLGAESQPVEIASAETAAAGANEAVATAGAARDEEDRRDRVAAQAAPPPAYAESAVADAAPVSRQSATSAAPVAAARVLAESPPERTAAGRTFVSTGGRWLEIGLALDSEPVEKVRRGELLSEDLLRRWPDLRILLGDRVPVRLRHEGRIVELQP